MSVWTPFCEFCGSQLVAMYGVLTCPHCGARFDESMFVINKPEFPGRVTQEPGAKVQREKLVEHPEKTTALDVARDIARVMEVVDGDGDNGREQMGEQEPGPPHDSDDSEKRE